MALASRECFDLSIAIIKECSVCIEKLSRIKTNLSSTGYNGNSSLHLICMKGNPLILENFLKNWLKNEMDINVRNWSEKTILHSINHKKEKCTECLEVIINLAHNGNLDINAVEINKLTPLYYAINMKCTNCIELLLANGAHLFEDGDDDALYKTLRVSNVDDTLFIIENASRLGVNLFKEYRFGFILHVLAYNCDTRAIKALSDINANININVRDGDGRTPLHQAVLGIIYAGEPAKFCIEYLLECGADTKLKDKDGCTAEDYNPPDCIKEIFANWQGLPSF